MNWRCIWYDHDWESIRPDEGDDGWLSHFLSYLKCRRCGKEKHYH